MTVKPEFVMRPITIAIMIAAIISGLVAVLLVRNVIGSRNTETSSNKIVVASRTLMFGEAISSGDIVEAPWSGSELPEGSFSSISDIIKDGNPQRYALTNIPKSSPIVSSQITEPGQKASLASMISDGKTAVTVRVDDVRGVAGFIMPGDRVDVALTRIDTSTHEGYVDTILRGMKVLAIDQIAKERQDTAQVAKSVTLEATSIEAEKLRLASEVGTLSLNLRNTRDSASQQIERITTADLSAAESPRKKTLDKESEDTKPSIRRPSTIRIIKGSDVAEATVFHE